MPQGIAEQFFSGLAKADALRRKHGPLCASCNSDQKNSDQVISQRLNRNHDAQSWIGHNRRGGRAFPLCRRHGDELLKTGAWKRIKGVTK